MTTTANPHTEAVEVDTLLADIYSRLWRVNATIASLEKARDSKWGLDPYGLKQLCDARGTRNAIEDEMIEVEARYTGWSRFFLVTNTNGHIHSSMHCTTCFPTTSYAWLPQLSGLSEAEAVEDQGEILCSVCFPSAPAEWTSGVSKATQQERDARTAKKAAAAQKKADKALYAGDPERVYMTQGSYSDRIATVAAAKMWLTDGYMWKWDHPSYSFLDAQNLAALLVGRPGVKETTPEAVLAAAEKRAAKRR